MKIVFHNRWNSTLALLSGGFVFVFLIHSHFIFAGEKTLKRIVTLSPALAEMVFALHAEESLVGVTAFSDFPPAAKKIQRVGAFNQPNMEKIISLKPDMIFLSPEGPSDIKEQLTRLHLPFTVVPMNTLDRVRDSALILGKYLSRQTEAQEFMNHWNHELKNFSSRPVKQSRTPNNKRPSVLIEVQSDPLMVAGQNTFLNEMVEHCGGKNSIAQNGYPRISKEKLFTLKINAVLLADFFQNKKDETRVIDLWHQWPTTKKTPVTALNPDLVSRPGPRLLEGLKQICRELHHEGF